MVFRVSGCFDHELAKVTNVVEGDRGMAKGFVVGIHRLRLREMKHGPEQHRGVTVREHEPVAVGQIG